MFRWQPKIKQLFYTALYFNNQRLGNRLVWTEADRTETVMWMPDLNRTVERCPVRLDIHVALHLY